MYNHKVVEKNGINIGQNIKHSRQEQIQIRKITML